MEGQRGTMLRRSDWSRRTIGILYLRQVCAGSEVCPPARYTIEAETYRSRNDVDYFPCKLCHYLPNTKVNSSRKASFRSKYRIFLPLAVEPALRLDCFFRRAMLTRKFFQSTAAKRSAISFSSWSPAEIPAKQSLCGFITSSKLDANSWDITLPRYRSTVSSMVQK